MKILVLTAMAISIAVTGACSSGPADKPTAVIKQEREAAMAEKKSFAVIHFV